MLAYGGVGPFPRLTGHVVALEMPIVGLRVEWLGSKRRLDSGGELGRPDWRAQEGGEGNR